MLQTPLEMSQQPGLDGAAKIRILIVERHAAVRRALRKRLNATANLEVVMAVQEPIEALLYLQSLGDSGDCSNEPEVILFGLHNGSDEDLFQTLDIIKQMVRCPASVIVLAPYADEVERLLLEQAGISNYLLKQIDSHRLILEIEAAARRGHPATPSG